MNSLWSRILNWFFNLDPIEDEPTPTRTPPWLAIAEKELGTDEIPGSKHNPRIIEYHATTHYKASSDEIPWCSSFVNWCVIKAGLRGTYSPRARSWEEWGLDLKDCPREGCVVILSRGRNPKTGHVGFYLGDTEDGDSILVLGGNQGNTVSIQDFPKRRLVGYRWPSDY